MKSQKCVLEKLSSCGKTVMVVLDGYKISEGKNGGVAPLLWALNDVGLVEDDEVLVLTVFSSQEQLSPDTASVCCLSRENKCHQSLAADRVQTLQEEIDRKRVMYTNIFKPYYDECKMNGVTFMLKIAVDYQPKVMIISEAKCAAAKWIVMDRCFADQDLQLSELNCNTVVSLVLVSDGEALLLLHKESDHRVSKMKAKEEPHIYSTLPHLVFDDQPSKTSSDHASTSTEGETLTWAENNNFACRELPGVHNKLELSLQSGDMRAPGGLISGEIVEINIALGFSLQLTSWEVISEITSMFKNNTDNDQNESFKMFRGNLPDHQCEALVKTFSSDLSSVLEAEKMVALSLHHKNILALIGYCQTANDISLAFPFTIKGTLENFLSGSRGKQWQLTFKDKLNIATGIAQGLHYMHEECPQGPVVHGGLKMSNIFLNFNLIPKITGFRNARWLQQELSSPAYRQRCLHKYKLDSQSVKLVKTDVLSFGIVLLRLFCRKNMPKDNQMLVNWAQPLLSIHAYHEMLDEEEECLDMYGVLRVMCVAAQCIKSRHSSRPWMNEVVSYLKGETSCTAEASPMLSEEHVLSP